MLGQKRGQILEKTRAQFGAKFHEKKKSLGQAQNVSCWVKN